jgi:DNA-binding MarR family transcriptional regulator
MSETTLREFLWFLDRCESRRLSIDVNRLAERFQQTPETIARRFHRLERQGLIRRTTAAPLTRATFHLTDKGRERGRYYTGQDQADTIPLR